MVERIDIGNVRGIKGDVGEKGDIGNTPTYEEIKYAKNEYGEFVTIQGEPDFTRCYEDSDGHLCNEDGYLIVDGELTETVGVPFDEGEYGYLYKPLNKWIDGNGKFTNENHELIDENGNTIKVLSTFIGDILTYLYGDAIAYDTLTNDIAPKVANTLLTSDPTDIRFKQFFNELEGDIKYYICEDNPELTIIENNGTISNTCKYQDENGNIVLEENSNTPATVPLEKNTLYLYENAVVEDDNIMHYNIYVCTKANTIPKKLVDVNDFRIDYNVIDDLTITVEETEEEDEYDVYLNLYTKGDYGEFYNKTDVDNLFDEKVDDKLGAVNGIAELGSDGKVKSSQLPSGIVETSEELTDILDSKEDISNKVTTLDNSGTHYPTTSAVNNAITTITNQVSSKENSSNKVTVLDNSDTHYPTTSAVDTAITTLRNTVNTKEDSSNKVNVLDNISFHYPSTTALNYIFDIFKQLIYVDVNHSKQESSSPPSAEITLNIVSNVVGLEYKIGVCGGIKAHIVATGYTTIENEVISSNNIEYLGTDYYIIIKIPNSNIELYSYNNPY